MSDIELRTKTTRTSIHNDRAAPGSHRSFRLVIEEMIRQGLALEQVDADQAIGPTLDVGQASDPRLLARLVRAYGQASVAPAVSHLEGTKDVNGTRIESSFGLLKKSN